ncbi:tRNA 5-methoxyuridine(34)/uridine 5-oxyacetic acid(34) synthase CmoB [Congregibacter litoralis]|uniref:tRNA U34 carboxymethyltransferase n=1 Tax=Congregibacter litoralis KT71 TaxID=314285 RepID=A4AD00_9GAMM|nr:tRNA 5-methoxyuridine(34)/uridine 5-oxyacetic acid(34) synthase CmoB [Congregibacter litoralis]EAQ96053.1 putative methyltransferase [Congregibacter litoralis KT71]
MIDVRALQERWKDGPLAPWAELLPAHVEAGLSVARHGDIPRWRAALESLPDIGTDQVSLNTAKVGVSTENTLDESGRAALEAALRGLCPWRKGPYELFGLSIDTEWHSDWKWDRLVGHIEPLSNRRVLDVGCGNGYHCWRMRGAGADEVIGIDPSPLFVIQFAALQRYIQDPAVSILPVGIEKLPPGLRAFDTAFSMGVLYHRRSPMEHLTTLRDSLRRGGQLVLETLVIEGDERQCLVPQGRYARMGNVWFIPSSAMLVLWLAKLGWKNPRVVDESVTTTEEQRPTDWMSFQSLEHFLDPEDPSLTLEGYPAPRRAIVIAEAP